jgi:hypothetical protein
VEKYRNPLVAAAGKYVYILFVYHNLITALSYLDYGKYPSNQSTFLQRKHYKNDILTNKIYISMMFA